MTDLVPNAQGPVNRAPIFADPVLQTGAITIDQDAYTSGLDRIYNVKGFSNLYIEIQNTGGANGLTYTIEKARKEYAVISTLVDADFNEVIKADTNVAFGANDANNVALVTPEITAIRIRIKRQATGDDTTLAGIVSAN